MEKKLNILICDDHIAIHESINAYLRIENMDSTSVYDGEQALEMLKDKDKHFDLLVLDVMLPKRFGTDVCKEIRKTSDIPIIMLSAKGEEIDRIVGLEIGADDYLTKPFSPREVVTRIKTILKRTHPKPAEPHIWQAGSLTVNLSGYETTIRQQPVPLTAKEMALLAYLMRHAGKVIDREELLYKVWGYDYIGDTRAVDTLVKRIRQKTVHHSPDFSIRSVYGVGYKFEELR